MKNYLLLGRAGDVCNFLPVIKYEADTQGYKPKLIIAERYSPILDGCSYVEPIIWKGLFWNYAQARIWAETFIPKDKIVNCSVTGRGNVITRKCHSFTRESWRLAECPVAWGTLPLEFDRRNPDRERNVIESLHLNEKPIVLMALKGYSSPFTPADDVRRYLEQNLPEYHLVDISEFRAERIYDLIPLLEKAHSLVTIDSGILHLAHAVPQLPVVSFISDIHTSEWFESAWRPQHILRLMYSEVPHNLSMIAKAARLGWNYPQRKIKLITTYGGNSLDNLRRVTFARNTWYNEQRYVNRIKLEDFPDELIENRNATMVGDTHKLPFVKDMIEYACRDINDRDVVMICNADVAFIPGITGWILQAVDRFGSLYMHRKDFAQFEKELVSEADIYDGNFYPGSDAFAFTKKWWIKNRADLYDVIFGRVAWDWVMRNLIRRSDGTQIQNAIYHERHKSFWEQKENRNCGGNTHNRLLAERWIKKYGGDANDWKYSQQYMKGIYI